MKFSHDLAYDAAPEAVAAMLADPGFRERVCAALHVLRHEVSVDGVGAGMQVMVDQTQPAKGIPSFAKRFVGDEIGYVQVEEWSSVDHAALTISIPGKPGEIDGSIDLAESGGTTTETVVMDIRVGIPFVGGKVESLVADMLRAALDIENQVGRDYLSR